MNRFASPAPLAVFALLTCFALLAAAPALAAPSAAGEEPVFNRHYDSDALTRYALEALLWDACPEDLAGVECVVARHEGRLSMTAPASVHRAVAHSLADLEARDDGHVRVDLVIAQPGATDSLAALSSSARNLLDGLRSRWDGAGLVHLDSATISTLERTRTNLTAIGRSFGLEAHARPAPWNAAPRRQIRLTHQGPRDEKDALAGGILDVTLSLPSGPTLAGTTHYKVNGPELIVLVTPDP